MRIHFILHAAFEKPGYIDTWITGNGYTSTATSLYKGEQLPSDDSYDFLIMMGGPQSPTDLEKFPYLKDEIEFTRKAIANNKSILGICLGAQIIGEAFNAKTERSPHKEIGVHPVSLTSDGAKDSIFKHFPKQFEVMHWHNDMPGISDGAIIIAESLGCPRQVVKYADKIYGLQCHFEMTQELVEEMLSHCKDDLQPSLYTQSPEKMLTANFSDINKKLHFILDEISSSQNFR